MKKAGVPFTPIMSLFMFFLLKYQSSKKSERNALVPNQRHSNSLKYQALRIAMRSSRIAPFLEVGNAIAISTASS